MIKDIGIHREQLGATLFFQFTNILNRQPGDPNLNLSNPATFGTITSTPTNWTPRKVEFGLRVHF